MQLQIGQHDTLEVGVKHDGLVVRMRKSNLFSYVVILNQLLSLIYFSVSLTTLEFVSVDGDVSVWFFRSILLFVNGFGIRSVRVLLRWNLRF